MTQSNYGPSVPLCRLYERVSKNGNPYLTGRLGAAKIAVLKSNEVSDDGVPIWNVVLSEAAAKPQGERVGTRTVRTEPDADHSRRQPLADDPVPFFEASQQCSSAPSRAMRR
jgi:hypothetical protein